MKRFCAFLGLLALGGLAAAMFWPSSGDALYDCTSTLAADRSHYHVGDMVNLTFTLTSKHEKTVRFYTEMHQNISLGLAGQNTLSSRYGKIEKIQLTPDHPLVVSIIGNILAGSDESTVVVDFGKYGRKVVNRGETFELRAKVYPAVISDVDSLEWPGSNHVSLLIAVEKPPTL